MCFNRCVIAIQSMKWKRHMVWSEAMVIYVSETYASQHDLRHD